MTADEKRTQLHPFALEEIERLGLQALVLEFDADWYTQAYASRDADWSGHPSPFAHYVRRGARDLGFSPNARFDEERYLDSHPDVRDAVRSGQFFCGFDHFLRHGRRERRVTPIGPVSDLAAIYPKIDEPMALRAVTELRKRLRVIPFVMAPRSGPRVNFLVPILHPTLLFGGYRCLLQLIDLVSRQVDCRILLTEDPDADVDRARLRDMPGLDRCEIVNVTGEHDPIPFSMRDRLVCYSAWTLHLAHRLARAAGLSARPVWLVQEHESIFHPHDACHALIEHAYALPHVAIFNTEILARHFRRNQLGVFARGDARLHRDFGIVSHAITDVRPPALDELVGRRSRRLLVYGRPEAHAARNLLEIVILGLERAVARGVFDSRWSFTGFGTLGASYEVELGSGRTLTLKPKLGVADYAKALREFDLGVSLMYAPHPSIVPFEMAGAGLVTVTNTFASRGSADLRRISPNLEPCSPDPEGLADALQRAVARVEDFPGRIKGSDVSWNRDWSKAFDPATRDFILDQLTA